MNSTPEERVHLIEKEGLFTRLAEENNLWQNITGAPEAYWWSTMRHPPVSVPNRFSSLESQPSARASEVFKVLGLHRSALAPCSNTLGGSIGYMKTSR